MTDTASVTESSPRAVAPEALRQSLAELLGERARSITL